MDAVGTLVIAYGNPLRGDDGVAHAAADMVATWQSPDVRVLRMHQLVPELIEDMKLAERVLFVDAAIDVHDAPFEFRELRPKESHRLLGHFESPENLLALLRELEGRIPDVWLLSIRAGSLDHGDRLTDDAKRHLDEAMVWIRGFVADRTCIKSG